MSFAGTVTSVIPGRAVSRSFSLRKDPSQVATGCGVYFDGRPLTINLAPQATFSIDTSGSMLPQVTQLREQRYLMDAGSAFIPTADDRHASQPAWSLLTRCSSSLLPDRHGHSRSTPQQPPDVHTGQPPVVFHERGDHLDPGGRPCHNAVRNGKEDQTLSGLSSFQVWDVVSVAVPLSRP